MRQLLMLFDLIHKIMGLRKKGEKEEALKGIQYFYSCLSIEKDIHELSIQSLLDFLENEKKLSNEQIEMVGYVLKEQGELSDQKEIKTDFFRKAYFLLDKVERESIAFSMDRQMKIAELREYLN